MPETESRRARPTPHRLPPADIEVSLALARTLLRSRWPALASRSMVPVAEGWDSYIVRVGRDHALRLPRRRATAALIRREQQWLPQIASWLPVAVPVPLVFGEPSPRFPWPWSVVRWVAGVTAERRPLREAEAPRLAAFLRALHRPAPAAAPVNPYRGVPLQHRRAVVEARLARIGRSPLEAIWRRAIGSPVATRTVWLHGDLHARNVLVGADGRVSGVIDWGDLTAGDPATDLACAWLLFETDEARTALFDAYGADPPTQRRAAAWAVVFASALVDSEAPPDVRMGNTVIRRLMT